MGAAAGLLLAAFPSAARAAWTHQSALGTDNIAVAYGLYNSGGNFAGFVLKSNGQIKVCVTPGCSSWSNLASKSGLVTMFPDPIGTGCSGGPYLYGIGDNGHLYFYKTTDICSATPAAWTWHDWTPSTPSCLTSYVPDASPASNSGWWARGCDGNVYRSGVNMNFQADSWGQDAHQIAGTVDNGLFVMDAEGWLYKFNEGTGHFDWLSSGPYGWPRARSISAQRWVTGMPAATHWGVQYIPNSWDSKDYFEWDAGSWSWPDVGDGPPNGSGSSDQAHISGPLVLDYWGNVYYGS
jgi:hypothetical protein